MAGKVAVTFPIASQAPEPWPEGGMEPVPSCPLCGANERKLLYRGLSDRVFSSAPGLWDLWRCGKCESAYLDPRPTRESLPLAYRRYYTHEDAAPPPRAVPHLRRALANGYRNSRYGAKLTPASKLGSYIGRIPPFGWGIDSRYRYLPRPPGRVLDIGAGDGEWLDLVRECGWQVAAVEPDPIARERIKGRGIEVRDSARAWLPSVGTFDAVTLSHSIEHVHEPDGLLAAAFELLRPGGQLFVETPNLDAVAHRHFGRNWISLDPPRHLILFNRRSLRNAVSSAGFTRIRFRQRPPLLPEIWRESKRIAAGLDPLVADGPDNPIAVRLLKLRGALQPSRSEYLTLTAIKE
jgi:SAM-dependent methyltransferase